MLKWIKKVFSKKKPDPNNPDNWERRIIFFDMEKNEERKGGTPSIFFNDIPPSKEEREALLAAYRAAKMSGVKNPYIKYYAGIDPIKKEEK